MPPLVTWHSGPRSAPPARRKACPHRTKDLADLAKPKTLSPQGDSALQKASIGRGGRGGPPGPDLVRDPGSKNVILHCFCDFDFETTSPGPPRRPIRGRSEGPFANLKTQKQPTITIWGTGVARKSGPRGAPAHHALKRGTEPSQPRETDGPFCRRLLHPHPPQRKGRGSASLRCAALALAARRWGHARLPTSQELSRALKRLTSRTSRSPNF